MKRTAALLALALTLGASSVGFQHNVRLNWAASADAAAHPSITYNVYRSSSCPGHFTQINPVPVVGTTYLDTATAVGASYCYQVTTVLSGVESLPSNQVTASMPPPLNREANCEHHGPFIGWIRCVAARPKSPAIGSQTP